MNEEKRRQAVLFNDIRRAPTKGDIWFSDCIAIADYLWAQGWTREVRPEDVNDPRHPQITESAPNPDPKSNREPSNWLFESVCLLGPIGMMLYLIGAAIWQAVAT